MCGNFSFSIDEVFRKEYKVKKKIEYSKDNIFPHFEIPVLMHEDESEIKIDLAEWSMMPNSLKLKTKFSTYNARIEHLTSSPLYHVPFKETHCLIPANSYFEWKKDGEDKVKYNISLHHDGLFCFAGLYKYWEIDGENVLTCTIITAPASNEIKSIHNRMPIVLPKDLENKWLNNLDDSMEVLEAAINHNFKYKYLPVINN